MRTFTPAELALCDGRDGRPSYVACDGTVYDVGESFLWRRGRNMAEHEAGRDLTEELGGAPHGADLLELCPVVGVLVAGA